MADLDLALDALGADRDRAIDRLFDLVRIKSISTDPAFAQDCRDAADWLARDLASLGFEVTAHPTDGHPIVLARDHHSDGPHVLFYGHYDVQPVDPLDLWEADPFEPRIETRPDGSQFMVGRGTSDDKGQVMTFIEACRAWRTAAGHLPCKVTILIEGEEESGGASLPPFLDRHRDLLDARTALVCDTAMWNRETPAITTSLRGMAREEVTIHAAERDLHSGFYGGAAANPITILAGILGALHDDAGRVVLEGFYDGVPEVPAPVLAQWERLGFSAEAFLAEVGLRQLSGEADRSGLEQIWSRPTAEINGIWGGYTGTGFKTVIPAEAHAKISFRLVGEQDPDRVCESFREFVQERIPADCRAEFVAHGGSRAISMPLSDPIFETTREALSREWGVEAAFIGCGGSIPVVGEFKRRLGLDTLLVGFGLEDDRIHSPNEKYELTSFSKGARSWARILAALGEA